MFYGGHNPLDILATTLLSRSGINTSSRDKMAAILTNYTFKCVFLNENDRIPIQVLLKFVSRGPIDNNPVGLDNGLAPNRRQAIIWTNADPIHWRIYAALGQYELTHWGRNKMAANTEQSTLQSACGSHLVIFSCGYFCHILHGYLNGTGISSYNCHRGSKHGWISHMNPGELII